MPVIGIRPLAATDVAVIPPAFAAAGWPGKPAEQYQRYLAEQRAGGTPGADTSRTGAASPTAG